MAVIPIEEEVYRISLAWSNCYVLRSAATRDCWLIDTGLNKDRAALLSALDQIKVVLSDIKCIVLTHGHCDHAGNAAFMQAQTGCRVLCGESEAPMLLLPRRTYCEPGFGALRNPLQSICFWSGEFIYPVERMHVVELLKDGDKLDAPGGEIHVINTPGHTPGHIALYRPSDQALFSGDAVMTVIPHILPSRRRGGLSMPLKLFSADWHQAALSARRLAELNIRMLASGHGWHITDDVSIRLRRWVADLC